MSLQRVWGHLACISTNKSPFRGLQGKPSSATFQVPISLTYIYDIENPTYYPDCTTLLDCAYAFSSQTMEY